MRRTFPFLLFLAALSMLSGWLMSRMSWIGRVGINLMHREYKFLKTWYEGAAVVFCVLLLLFVIQLVLQRRLSFAGARVAHIVCLVLAALGLYVTYRDFRTDFTHGLLRERFHLGAYLFWIGWMAISFFFLTAKRTLVIKPDMPSKL